MGLAINTQAYCDQWLTTLELRVNDKPVSPQERDTLLFELDETSHALQRLREEATNVNDFALARFAEMEERIVYLHGRIHDQTIRFVVTLIQAGTQFLEQVSDLKIRAEIIDIMKDHINFLFSNYSPALQDRKLIFMALGMDLGEWAYVETEAVLEDLANLYHDKKAIRPQWNRLTQKQKELFYSYLMPQEAAMGLLHDEKRPTDYEQVLWG